jgi:hypothetical protein
MSELPIGQMPAEEFETLIENFITQRSGQDDRLPGDVFFELLGRYESEGMPQGALDLKGDIMGDRLVLSAPPGMSVPANIREIEVNLPGMRVIVAREPVAA